MKPIVAYGVFAVTTLPASAVLARLAPAVAAAGVEGTIWNGRAQVLQAGNLSLGSASWKLHALPLFLGRARADVKITRSDGFAQTTVTASLFGDIRLEQTTASLPLSALPPSAIPGGWRGTLNLKLAHVVLQKGWPVQAEGTLEALDLTGPARQPQNLGSYKVTFAGTPSKDSVKQSPSDASKGAVDGALVDLGGPLQIAGSVLLKPDRSYVAEGMVLARPDAPQSVVNTLQFLGPPEADGRRQFHVSGTT